MVGYLSIILPVKEVPFGPLRAIGKMSFLTASVSPVIIGRHLSIDLIMLFMAAGYN